MTEQVKEVEQVRVIRKGSAETMSLLLNRYSEHVAPLPDEYKVSQYSDAIIEEAASAYAAWDNSDPFAKARMRLHCQRGIENPHQIAPEFRSKKRVREIMKAMEIDKAMGREVFNAG